MRYIAAAISSLLILALEFPLAAQYPGRYPPGGGYPPQGGGYPPQGGGYPPQGGGYPPQGGGWQ